MCQCQVSEWEGVLAGNGQMSEWVSMGVSGYMNEQCNAFLYIHQLTFN